MVFTYQYLLRETNEKKLDSCSFLQIHWKSNWMKDPWSTLEQSYNAVKLYTQQLLIIRMQIHANLFYIDYNLHERMNSKWNTMQLICMVWYVFCCCSFFSLLCLFIWTNFYATDSYMYWNGCVYWFVPLYALPIQLPFPLKTKYNMCNRQSAHTYETVSTNVIHESGTDFWSVNVCFNLQIFTNIIIFLFCFIFGVFLSSIFFFFVCLLLLFAETFYVVLFCHSNRIGQW